MTNQYTSVSVSHGAYDYRTKNSEALTLNWLLLRSVHLPVIFACFGIIIWIFHLTYYYMQIILPRSVYFIWHSGVQRKSFWKSSYSFVNQMTFAIHMTFVNHMTFMNQMTFVNIMIFSRGGGPNIIKK